MRDKISRSRRGKGTGPFSEEHKAKLSASNKGKKRSKETCARISAAKKGCNLGRKHTPETRAKMSAALKGKPRPKGSAALMGHSVSEETRAKISESLKGRKLSAEHRKSLSVSKKGKPRPYLVGREHSPEHKASISAALKGRLRPGISGPKHPRWLGGISRKPYTFSFSPELKKEIRERDGCKCQLCGVPQIECSRKLSVHHIDYDKKNSDPVNLITLCNTCRSRTNINRDHWKALFQHVMLKRSLDEHE